MLTGPQGERIAETDAEWRSLSDSSVAAGTDREQAITKFAASIIRGPQNEIILPPCEEGICPLCGADFPESCSQPSDTPDTEDDDDREPEA